MTREKPTVHGPRDRLTRRSRNAIVDDSPRRVHSPTGIQICRLLKLDTPENSGQPATPLHVGVLIITRFEVENGGRAPSGTIGRRGGIAFSK
jgi:hypothetical protein